MQCNVTDHGRQDHRRRRLRSRRKLSSVQRVVPAYRDPSHCQESLGRCLAPLAHLHTLAAYLDYEDTPRPKFDRPRVRGFQYSSQDIDRFTATLHRAANVLARAMGPSVERVQLWRPRELEGYEWLAFRAVRGPDGAGARCEEDWRGSGRRMSV